MNNLIFLFSLQSSFQVRDVKVQEKSGKVLKSWGFKSLKLKALKPHGLCVFRDDPAL